MICPDCSHENIDGVDCCESCGQDLTAFDRADEGASLVETSIMRSPLTHFRSRPPVIVSGDTTVADAILQLCEHRVGCLLVGTSSRIKGIFSERDVLLRIAHRYDEVAGEPISSHMTPDPVHLEMGNPIAYLLNRMSTGDFRHLPITREGEIVGVISLRDVLSFLADWFPDLVAPVAARR